MARPDKAAVVDRISGDLREHPAALFTEYRGLSVGELATLRAELRQAGARYQVVKNTLARRAATEAGFEELIGILTGPTAVAYCDEDPVGPAKALRRFAKDHPQLVIKGGLLDGAVLDAAAAGRLADLESREELLARMARLAYAALANTASLLQAPLGKMARLFAALEAERGGPLESEQPEPADAEPETPGVAEAEAELPDPAGAERAESEPAATPPAEAAAEATSDQTPSDTDAGAS